MKTMMVMDCKSGCSMTLGEFVKQNRLARGLTQSELAAIAKLSISVVNQIETGITPNPTILTLKALSRAWRPQKDFWNFISKEWSC